jgi:ribosomal protein L37AE/L43A
MTAVETRAQSVRESFRRSLSTLGDLLSKQGLLALIAQFISIGLTFAGLENSIVDPFIFNLAAAAGGGIILGLFARWLLRDRTFMLRWVSAVIAVILTLFLAGWFTQGVVGILPTALPRPQPDWIALVLLLVGAAASALVLEAHRWWIRDTTIALVVVENADAEQRANVHPEPGRVVEVAPRVRRPVLERMRSGLRGWRKRARRDEVRLVGAEEHRCPYCLQLIDRRDPRGVVVCPVCHTQHHRDCWAVTGMCQVPHYHA